MKSSTSLKILIGLSAAFGIASPGFAQATRTWVSGVGDDANPCSRTAPCKTFAGAISKTAAGGEINCLDPGGFGAVTIVKSISIICDFTEGGILTAGAGVNGIVINLPSATDTVFLSGLDFNGAGTAQNGIRIVSGGIIHVQNSLIRNYRATNGLGMSIQPSAVAQLTVENTTIADNGTGNTGGGILIQPTGASGTARVTLRNVRLQNNAHRNLRADTSGTSGLGIGLVVENSQFIGATTGLSLNGGGASPINFALTGAHISFAATGIEATGSGIVSGRVDGSTITRNSTALAISGTASVQSFGTNNLEGNVNASSFTPPLLTKQ